MLWSLTIQRITAATVMLADFRPMAFSAEIVRTQRIQTEQGASGVWMDMDQTQTIRFAWNARSYRP
jgi:hypothetical protein